MWYNRIDLDIESGRGVTLQGVGAIAYQALYRSYRPKAFSDLVGQTHVTTTLRRAVASGRVAHAYLFAGPRGTGKTSAAKILAKALNCLSPQDGEPCNACAHCRAIDAGEALDVVELDAASNRGIDEIRAVRDATWFKPAEMKVKVYIIDEVHMLTNEAANALLKTLEEPPEHVVFILATTDPEKIPATILSRVQRFDFRRLSPRAMRERLLAVAEREGILLSDAALDLFVAFADGGMRDALALLDQVRAFAGEKIEADDVRAVAGIPEDEELAELLDALGRGDAVKLYTTLEAAYGAGREPERLARGLARALREVFYGRRLPDAVFRPTLIKAAEALDDAHLVFFFAELAQLEAALRASVDPYLRLEAALIALLDPPASVARSSASPLPPERWSRIEARLATLEARLSALETLAASPRTSAPPTAGPATDGPERAIVGNAAAGSHSTRRRAPDGGGTAYGRAGENDAAPAVSPPAPQSKRLLNLAEFAASGETERLEALLQRWPEVLAAVKQKDIRSEAWLKRGRPAAVKGDVLLLVFSIPLHRKMTEQAENRAHIEAVLRSFGEEWPKTFVTALEEEWAPYVRGEPGERSPIVQAAIDLVGPEYVEIRERRRSE
ncbi:MAG: DNA polymerase III subunit gamma/tau [Hydrogenibacillus sp.]|nr:DNA polymerase III subunit gamma/tau [Hydrogenibacillus sp.]